MTKGTSDLSKPSQVLPGSPGRETRWGCSDPLRRILPAALTALYPEAGQRQPVISGALALVVSCGGGNTRSTWVREKQKYIDLPSEHPEVYNSSHFVCVIASHLPSAGPILIYLLLCNRLQKNYSLAAHGYTYISALQEQQKNHPPHSGPASCDQAPQRRKSIHKQDDVYKYISSSKVK